MKNDSGEIEIEGQSVKIKNPHHARQLGVATIFQELSQIPTLSVAENVFLGNETKKSGLLDRNTMIKQTTEILYRYGIELDPTAPLNTLSAAQRQLAEIVERAVGRRGKIHPATRVFQALRIAVNRELEVLDKVLPQIVQTLKPGGRVAIISFHSLEDRRVKNFFRSTEQLRVLTKHPLRPTDEELTANPRSRSAKLRVAEKIC